MGKPRFLDERSVTRIGDAVRAVERDTGESARPGIYRNPSSLIRFVDVTSTVRDGVLYPAKAKLLDGSTLTWLTFADCWLMPPSGQTLKARRYPAVLACERASDDKLVFVALLPGECDFCGTEIVPPPDGCDECCLTAEASPPSSVSVSFDSITNGGTCDQCSTVPNPITLNRDSGSDDPDNSKYCVYTSDPTAFTCTTGNTYYVKVQFFRLNSSCVVPSSLQWMTLVYVSSNIGGPFILDAAFSVLWTPGCSLPVTMGRHGYAGPPPASDVYCTWGDSVTVSE